MSADIAVYLARITAEHADKPNFVATVSLLVQGPADERATLAAIPGLYDLDTAVGAQLDTVGLWAGVSRNLPVPLTGVYFSFDTPGLGFDQGVWWDPGDPTTQLDVLPDGAYRTLIRAKIASNQWDGTIPSAYAVWNELFAGTGLRVLIIDNQGMSMELGLTGALPDAITLALFTGGYLDLKPAGVQIVGYFYPTVPYTPFFGFDVENDAIAGFDTGSWAGLSPPRGDFVLGISLLDGPDVLG